MKGERKTQKRNALNAVVSGTTVIENEVLEKVRQHKRKNQGKNVLTDSRKGKSRRRKRKIEKTQRNPQSKATF